MVSNADGIIELDYSVESRVTENTEPFLTDEISDKKSMIGHSTSSDLGLKTPFLT